MESLELLREIRALKPDARDNASGTDDERFPPHILLHHNHSVPQILRVPKRRSNLQPRPLAACRRP
jgi:hypothetical protein